MSLVPALLLTPALGGAILAVTPSYRVAATLNVLFSAVTFGLGCALIAVRPEPDLYFFIDDFNVYLVALTAFVALTTAEFSRGYIQHEIDAGRITPKRMRIYHAGYQLLQAAMLLALVANNIGVLWVAVEGATLVTVLLVSMYRTAEALEASWKYFILGSVGIALALFGTILIYLAGQGALGAGVEAMAWTHLLDKAPQLTPAVLNLAFVFLLVGYGTKVGLAPLHAWLPDAHAEGPTPISSVLSGLLLNVALYALLRFKMVLAANGAAMAPGPLMMSLGIGSLFVAGLMLYRREDAKRFFAYSSIEHMGVATFAFGLGGPTAAFAGLLHMAMHSIIKSAIFFCVGRMAQLHGSQRLKDLTGLTVSHPALGWAFVFLVAAIAGLPPFGLFMSEFLVVSSVFNLQPWLAAPFALGLLIAFAALLLRMQGVAFGPPRPTLGQAPPSTLIPVYLHLSLALVAGIWTPPPLAAWFQHVAGMIG